MAMRQSRRAIVSYAMTRTGAYIAPERSHELSRRPYVGLLDTALYRESCVENWKESAQGKQHTPPPRREMLLPNVQKKLS